MTLVFRLLIFVSNVFALPGLASAAVPGPALSRADYADCVEAVWTGQIAAMLMAWPYEHRVAATQRVTDYPRPYTPLCGGRNRDFSNFKHPPLALLVCVYVSAAGMWAREIRLKAELADEFFDRETVVCGNRFEDDGQRAELDWAMIRHRDMVLAAALCR